MKRITRMLDAAFERSRVGVLVMHAFGVGKRHHHRAMLTGTAVDCPPALTHWLLMVVAMMFPFIIGPVRGTAIRSLWRRRHRAIASFLLHIRRGCGLSARCSLAPHTCQTGSHEGLPSQHTPGPFGMARVPRLLAIRLHHRRQLCDCLRRSYGRLFRRQPLPSRHAGSHRCRSSGAIPITRA